MKSFKLRARTVVNPEKWYTFSLADLPTKYDKDHIALCAKMGSPLLNLDPIVRGDPETELYEGDIIEENGDRFVICYERGFYAINADYVTKHLYMLKDYKVVGDYWLDGFPVEIHPRKKQLYHYNNLNFKLTDITGRWGNKLIIRSSTQPIDPADCQQECCLVVNDRKIFLGDVLDDHEVILAGGRICIHDNKGYKDISTGGYLDGYNP